jgi:hypothetical protein
VNRYLYQGITVPSFRAAHKGLMSHGYWGPLPFTDSREPVRNGPRHLVLGVDRALGLPEPYDNNPLLGRDDDQLADVAVSGIRIAATLAWDATTCTCSSRRRSSSPDGIATIGHPQGRVLLIRSPTSWRSAAGHEQASYCKTLPR